MEHGTPLIPHLYTRDVLQQTHTHETEDTTQVLARRYRDAAGMESGRASQRIWMREDINLICQIPTIPVHAAV